MKYRTEVLLAAGMDASEAMVLVKAGTGLEEL
jgi:hypothetical protein